MKKLITSLATGTTFLTIATQAHAADFCPKGVFNAICSKSVSGDNFAATLGSVINVAFFAATIMALLFLIWGGIKWLMSQGDKAAVEGARQHIINALIGLVIVFLSYIIINLLLTVLGVSGGLSNIPVPHL